MVRLPVIVLVLALATSASADTGSTLGDRSGEGSTPFTGLAQAPEANLFTGALTTGIPLALPPGRGGMTPQLTLQYASSAGAGVFGYGWDLPLGRIERSGTWGVPRCTGAHTDDFVLVLPTGASELVRESANSAYYRPRVEQAWVRAQRFEAENRWEVVDRSGRRYTFGDVDAARIATGTPAVFLAEQPDGSCALTAQWALTRVEDPNGNTIDITWAKIFNVLYPITVRWGGNAAAGVPHLYTVRFALQWRAEDDRPISYRLGVRSRLALRVTTIDVETDAPTPGTFVRRYALEYEDAASGQPSLLAAVVTTGQPTQHFLYTPAVSGHAGPAAVPVPAGAYQALRVSNASQEVAQTVLDMNGDGLLDLVRSDDPPAGSWAVWWGTVDANGTAAFATPPVAWAAPGNWTYLRYVAENGSGCPSDWSCTRTDTLDLTGDGIPDHVDADNASGWTVHPGRGAPQWGFGPPRIWSSPRRFLRRSRAGDTFQDVIDVNGDGLPDLVESGAPGQSPPYQWQVYLNTGFSFAAAPLPYWPAPVHRISDGESNGVRQLLTDFNGDGLPDIVRSGYSGSGAAFDARCAPSASQDTSCLEVYLNTGQGFGEAEPLIAVPPATGVQLRSGGEVYQDLFDVNGDGLPDLVYRRFDWSLSSFDPEWRVLLNLGGTFEPLIYVPHTFVPTWTEGIPERVWSGGAGFFRRAVQGRSEIDVIDLNGDGMLDHVSAGSGAFSVRFHDAGQRPNLLAVIENGIGGTSSVVYRPSTAFDNTGGDGVPDLPFIQWVVDRMRQNDGLCTPPPDADPFVAGTGAGQNPCIDAGHELVSSYQYEDGRFDPVERVFRGFRRVVRASHQGSGAPPNLTATVFAQDALAAGRILQVDTYAGDSTLVRSELNLWGTRDTGLERSQIWLAENRRTVFDPTGGIPQHTATCSAPPDAWGNVTHHWTEGLFGTARVDTFTTYAVPTGEDHVYDKPALVRITDASGVLAEQWLFYDGSTAGLLNGQVTKGNLKRIRHRLTPTDAGGPQTRIAYDAAGNPVSVTDPNGRVTTTAYDTWLLHPRTVTNPLGHVTTITTDYRWGRPVRHVDANGAVTEFAFDAAGRPTCTARPGASLAACSTTHTYHFASTPGALSWVEIAHRQDGGRPPLRARHHFDALGRPRYSDTARVVDGEPTVVRSNHVEYDAGGRPHVLHHPYPAAAGTPNNGATRTDYHFEGGTLIDPLGRPHQVTNSDGTTRRTRYRGSLTQSWDEEDHLTESRVDPHGREIERRTAADAGTFVTVSQVYDGLGRVLEERQNGLVLRASAYDSLGRRTIMVDADSGTWRYGYDNAGNLLWQDDPRPASHVQMCYDALDRPTRRCALATDFDTLRSCTSSSACPDPEQVHYAYDDAAVPHARGRLVRVEDASGTTEVIAYDARGRRLGMRKRIDIDGVVGTGEFAYAYDGNDRVTAITYPDGEIVRTEYDDAGQPIALYNQSNVFYVTDAHYDLFGRLTRLQHGNGLTDTRVYGGAADRHRLRALRTAPPNGTPLLDLGYPSYSPRGLLRTVADGRDPSGPRSNAADYTYDALGRLTAVDSAWDGADRTFTYDWMGNLVRNGDRLLLYLDANRPHQPTAVVAGARIDGIGHDANGNRTGKGAQAYTYDAFDRLARIEVDGYSVRVLHDADGRQVARVVEGTTLLSRTRFYDQLVEVTGALQTKSYYLGPLRVASLTNESVLWQVAARPGGGILTASASPFGPQLLVRLAPAAATWTVLLAVMFGATLLRLGRPRRAVVGWRVRPGQALGAALLALVAGLPWPLHVAPAEAGGYGPAFAALRHYHTDHLGSTQVITDAAGVAVEQIRYLPYGGVRGRWAFDGTPLAQPANPAPHEFAGYQLEPLSGLSYAGARFYDPELGLFLTHDPGAQFASPYSYGGGDPLNWSDPDGRFFLELLGAVAIGAVLSAAVSTVIAAAQGAPLSVIGKAALGGAVAGAIGVGLGVAFAATAAGVASAAGTLGTNVTLQAVGQQLVNVAWRSVFSTTLANTAGQAAAAAGAPAELAMFASMAAGYLGSFAFDQLLAEHFSGPIVRAPSGQNGAQMCSNTSTHSDITTMAALDAGFSPAEAETLRNANLLQDTDVWNNQTHFDFGARRLADDLTQSAEVLQGGEDFLETLGAASHHVQDQYAFGHILPGTSSLSGPYGSPLRFLIHQTIGGEVTFRQASYDATLKLFQRFQSGVPGAA